MKRSIILLLSFVLLLAACDGVGGIRRGSGNVITEERDVSGFDQIQVTGSGMAEVIQGETESLVIEAEDNVMPTIESEVRDGVLVLGQKANANLNITKPVKYTVTMIDIAGFAISGSGAISSDSVDTSIIELAISGSGNIDITSLDGDSVEANLSGSGDVQVSGDVADQVVEISGSGKYDAADLRSATAVITIGGSGSATVWVDTTLDVTVGGSGDVSYYGDPILTQSVSGSGQVNGLGAR